MRCAIDAKRFDRLAKSLSSVNARRHVLQLLAALPFVGGLATLADEDAADARGRRKRRKKAHKHGKGRHKKKHHKKPCKAHSTARTCAGTCGSVTNNCKKSVDCGSCDCDPPCGTCFACQGAAGQPGTCVPASDGTACGDAANCSGGEATAQGACDGSGTCVPGTPISCAPYTQCAGNDCAASCADDNDCVTGSFCNGAHLCVGDEPDGASCANGGQCQSGFCVDDVCCDSACDGACEACNLSGAVGACTTEDDGSTCGSGDICCADGCVDTETDPQNCGACGADCPGDQVCQGGVCGEVCGSDFCPAPDEICCNDVCCNGCCGADGSCGACLVFVSSSESTGNLGGLAGADQTCQTLAENATLPGEYKAWLSINDDPNQSPASGRFRRSGQPYLLVNGTQIAANWADLTDGSLAAPISLTESGQGVSSSTRMTWTNTRTDGTAGGHFDVGLLSCDEWQDGSSGNAGNEGDTTETGVGWTFIALGSCNITRNRLYCFQQR